MRVEINHSSVQQGFLFKTTYYAVDLMVHFNHEDMQIIRQRNLAEAKIMDRRPATAKVDDRDDKFALHLKHILNGQCDCFLCATPSAAKAYEVQLLIALEQVKLWLGENAELGTRVVTEF